MVLLDLVYNLWQTLAAHATFAIRNQNDLPFKLELLAEYTDHLDSENK